RDPAAADVVHAGGVGEDQADAGVGEGALAAGGGAGVVVLVRFFFGAGIVSHAPEYVAGDVVGFGAELSADAVVVGAVGDFQSAADVADVLRSGLVGADEISLHAVAVAAGQIKHHAAVAVGGDDIARAASATDG